MKALNILGWVIFAYAIAGAIYSYSLVNNFIEGFFMLAFCAGIGWGGWKLAHKKPRIHKDRVRVTVISQDKKRIKPPRAPVKLSAQQKQELKRRGQTLARMAMLRPKTK